MSGDRPPWESRQFESQRPYRGRGSPRSRGGGQGQYRGRGRGSYHEVRDPEDPEKRERDWPAAEAHSYMRTNDRGHPLEYRDYNRGMYNLGIIPMA